MYGDIRNEHDILIGTPEGNRPLGKHMHVREDNIRMNLKEIKCQKLGTIRLTQDRVRWLVFVNSILNLRIPYKTELF
jgi:hypothetical protein